MEKTITLTVDESRLLLSPLLAEIKFYRSLVSDIESSDIEVYFPDCTIEEANKIVASHRDRLHELEILFTRIFGYSSDIHFGGVEK